MPATAFNMLAACVCPVGRVTEAALLALSATPAPWAISLAVWRALLPGFPLPAAAAAAVGGLCLFGRWLTDDLLKPGLRGHAHLGARLDPPRLGHGDLAGLRLISGSASRDTLSWTQRGHQQAMKPDHKHGQVTQVHAASWRHLMRAPLSGGAHPAQHSQGMQLTETHPPRSGHAIVSKKLQLSLGRSQSQPNERLTTPEPKKALHLPAMRTGSV